MKWYFAARTKHREQILSLTKFLESKNQTVISEWIFHFPKKPFHEHIVEAQKLAQSIVDSVLQVDIFVLMSDSEGTDMFIELGIAIAYQKQSPDMRIYIVGEHNKRSLMHLYSGIIHVMTMDEIFIKEGIEV